MSADQILANAAETFAERRKVYGDNYKRVGAAMAALFPNGVELKTADDHNRFHILMLVIVKLSRYCVNWEKGGHQDSIHDAAVYCAMLEDIDDAIVGADVTSRLRAALSKIQGGKNGQTSN
jgi:hypothetical protein